MMIVNRIGNSYGSLDLANLSAIGLSKDVEMKLFNEKYY
jgi:hypothetical protein